MKLPSSPPNHSSVLVEAVGGGIVAEDAEDSAMDFGTETWKNVSDFGGDSREMQGGMLQCRIDPCYLELMHIEYS